jgi:hypothetical protein
MGTGQRAPSVKVEEGNEEKEWEEKESTAMTELPPAVASAVIARTEVSPSSLSMRIRAASSGCR